MRLGSCYSYDDCWDDGEGYYYDDDTLACGWAYNREWPWEGPESNEGRCIYSDECGSAGEYKFEFGWFVCDERYRFDVFEFLGITWSASEGDVVAAAAPAEGE